MKPSSNEYQKLIKKAKRLAYLGLTVFVLSLVVLCFRVYDPNFSVFVMRQQEIVTTIDEDKIEKGIHVKTGFIDVVGLLTVINNCTNCHSSKLVIQNRMNADRWNATIKWMQETQNLWQLGNNQKVIVDYLVKNYPPVDKGRREGLKKTTWYKLKD